MYVCVSRGPQNYFPTADCPMMQISSTCLLSSPSWLCSHCPNFLTCNRKAARFCSSYRASDIWIIQIRRPRLCAWKQVSSLNSPQQQLCTSSFMQKMMHCGHANLVRQETQVRHSDGLILMGLDHGRLSCHFIKNCPLFSPEKR